MKSFRLSTIFAFFFDPKVPVLFLVGSIALALLGNAIYDLILIMFGNISQTIVAVGVGAVLIFLFVLLGFRVLVGVLAQRTRRRVADVPEDRQAEPHTGLMLLVSANPDAPELQIVDWHLREQQLRHCWLATSPQSAARADDLAFRLRERNVQPHRLMIRDANQVRDSYRVIGAGVMAARRLLGDTSLIIDVTGGTKMMTIGAVMVCLDAAIAMQYYVSVRLPDGRPDPASTAVPMKVNVIQDIQDIVL